jgi:hypothetical protein
MQNPGSAGEEMLLRRLESGKAQPEPPLSGRAASGRCRARAGFGAPAAPAKRPVTLDLRRRSPRPLPEQMVAWRREVVATRDVSVCECDAAEAGSR